MKKTYTIPQLCLADVPASDLIRTSPIDPSDLSDPWAPDRGWDVPPLA